MALCEGKNIYLAGMIGSGKTTVGMALARRTGRPFLDLDRELKKDSGWDVHGVVEREGWLGFRQREYEIVKRFATLREAVVGLGGGTVRYAWNRDVLAGTGPIVLLTAELSVLADRVRAVDRPRVNPGTTLEEDLRLIWEGNETTYRRAATFVYRTDQNKSPEDEAAEIIGLVGTGRGGNGIDNGIVT